MISKTRPKEKGGPSLKRVGIAIGRGTAGGDKALALEWSVVGAPARDKGQGIRDKDAFDARDSRQVFRHL